MKNDSGSFLILEDGNLERFEVGKREPAHGGVRPLCVRHVEILKSGHDVVYGIRERYLWELIAPASDDPLFQQLPGQFRAELHDRFMAPIYPFAFAALTFAFLGYTAHDASEPQFLDGSVDCRRVRLAHGGVRLSVMAVKSPLAPLLQYLLLFGCDRRQPPGDHWRNRDRTARRVDGSNQQIERTAPPPAREASRRMSMLTNTIGPLFCRPFCSGGDRRVRQHLSASRSRRLHRNGPAERRDLRRHRQSWSRKHRCSGCRNCLKK